jgi:hypothetical protein
MSDDLITSVVQLSFSGESKVSAEDPTGKKSQSIDFEKVFSEENKRLVKANSPVEEDDAERVLSQEEQDTSSGFSGKATSGQYLANDLRSSGSTLPNLSLHNRALEVGRVIYTADTVAVTNESLSKFMERQGLISNRLFSGSVGGVAKPLETDQSVVGNPLTPNRPVLTEDFLASDDPMLAERSSAILSAETLGGSVSLRAGNAEDESVNSVKTHSDGNANAGIVVTAPSGSNAITQLVVKQMINSHGSIANDASSTIVRKVSAEKIDAASQAIIQGDDSPPAVSGKHNAGQSLSPVVEVKDLMEKSIRPTAGVQKDIVRGDLILQPVVDTAPAGREFMREMKVLGEELPEIISKKQHDQTGDLVKGSKLQANRDFELPQLEALLIKRQEGGGDNSPLSSTSSMENLELSLKAYRDVTQVSEKDSLNNETAYNRVEFKGALKEAQRMVASNSYNNLTDSYESWSVKFGEILAQRIAGYMSKENWNIQLRLNPASLGEISLELELNEKGLEGRFGSNEESTRQLLQDTLPKLRLALRDLIDENKGLSFDVSDFGNANSGNEDQPEKNASPEIVEEINFETDVLLGRTLDARLGSVVGLDILV